VLPGAPPGLGLGLARAGAGMGTGARTPARRRRDSILPRVPAAACLRCAELLTCRNRARCRQCSSLAS
jgi:hypothetical protein